MAIYVYKCADCGKQVEKIRKMSELNRPVFCEACGGQCRPVPAVPSPMRWGRLNS